MSPRVSVIVPAYNAARYVRQAVNSALRQTVTDLEVLVIDDASDDDTAAIVAAIDDKRLRLLRIEPNGGPARARNRGLEAASGEWIAFLDADDWMQSRRLEALLALAAMAQTELVADNLYLIQDAADQPWGTIFDNSSLQNGEVLDARQFIQMERGLQPMIRRDFLEGKRLHFNEELRTGEDGLLVIDCLLAGGQLAVTTSPHYFYRCRRDSLTSNRVVSLQRKQVVFEGLLRREEVLADYLLQQALEAKLVKIRRGLEYYLVIEPLKSGDISGALAAVLKNPGVFLLLLGALPVACRHRLSMARSYLRTSLLSASEESKP